MFDKVRQSEASAAIALLAVYRRSERGRQLMVSREGGREIMAEMEAGLGLRRFH